MKKKIEFLVMDAKKIINKISNFKTVSFDIFDTLLYRPYLHPTDLFNHIEELSQRPGFKVKRIEAERRARELTEREDIDHEEIYECIPDEFKNLKETELELEINTLKLNPVFKEVLEYCKSKNKTVLIISDMYLKHDFIEKVLEKCGIQYNELFVSSEYGLTKSTGTLYNKVCEKLNLNAKEIIHIGDNRNSDVKNAKKAGLNAIRYRDINRQYRKTSSTHKSEFNLFTQKGSFSQRYLFKNKVNKTILEPNYYNQSNCKSEFYKSLGYEYGSLLALSFYDKISNTYNPEKDELIFVGRDGFAIKRFFDIIKPEWESHYIHAPRYISHLSNQNSGDIDVMYSFIDYLNKSKNLQIEDINKLLPHEKFDIIEENLSLLKEYSANILNSYKRYLSNEGVNLNKRLLIIDTITVKFSAQKLFSTVSSSQNVKGLYFYMSNPYELSYDAESVFNEATHGISEITKNWDFVEFLLSSSEPSIEGINVKDDTIIYRKESINDKIHSEIKPHILKGIEEAAHLLRNAYNGTFIASNPNLTVLKINNFIENLSSKEFKYLNNVMVAIDSAHSKYIPLFSTNLKFFEIIFNHKKAKIAKQAHYFSLIQSLALLIIYPLRYKYLKKEKKLTINLIQCLNWRILRLNIQILGKFSLRLTVGSLI